MSCVKNLQDDKIFTDMIRSIKEDCKAMSGLEFPEINTSIREKYYKHFAYFCIREKITLPELVDEIEMNVSFV